MTVLGGAEVGGGEEGGVIGGETAWVGRVIWEKEEQGMVGGKLVGGEAEV